MPWLIKDPEDPSKDLLFVHVPRAGGTSLTTYYNVPQKARYAAWRDAPGCLRNPYRWFGMVYFFYRYWLLESQNFPWKTWENLIVVVQFTIAAFLLGFEVDTTAKYVMWGTGAFMFLTSTFLFTAPLTGRNVFWRRVYGFIVGRLMLNFVASEQWLTGTNHHGFLVHFTAQRMIYHGFASEQQLQDADSFAIVRNPYSRMVSVFMYNKFPMEEFKNFVKDVCYSKMSIYKELQKEGKFLQSTHEWNIYCHFLPMYEFTHLHDKQIVKCVVKQEELKQLWAPGINPGYRHARRLNEIPPKVRAALQGMPHKNARPRPKPWYDFYDQETQDLVYKTYAKDFALFKYSPKMPFRNDLKPPPLSAKFNKMSPFSSNLDFSMYKPGEIRQSVRSIAISVDSKVPETIKEVGSGLSQDGIEAIVDLEGGAPPSQELVERELGDVSLQGLERKEDQEETATVGSSDPDDDEVERDDNVIAVE